MSKLIELQELVQEAIDNGATSVEEIHKTLANKPFEILEKINISGGVVEKLQDFQNQTIGNVYDLIRTVNNKIGEIASDLLSKIETEESEKSE